MKYDMHVHTDADPCSRLSPEGLVSAAKKAGLDGLLVANHGTLEGAREVEAAAPEHLDVIPGVEIDTDQGHIIAIAVSRVPEGGDPLDVIDRIHRLGGLAVLAHPFDLKRPHFAEGMEDLADAVDAVEVINSRCLRKQYNEEAEVFASKHGLPKVGGSDAHFGIEVGRAYTSFEGAWRDAIESGETKIYGKGSYLTGHVATKMSKFAGKWR